MTALAGATPLSHRGRDKIHWGPEVWARVDAAVTAEASRSRVAAQYLPIHRVPEQTTVVPSDIVDFESSDGSAVTFPAVGTVPTTPLANPRWSPPASPSTTTITALSDDGLMTRLIEFWVEFALTPQQVEQEGSLGANAQSPNGPAAGLPMPASASGSPMPAMSASGSPMPAMSASGPGPTDSSVHSTLLTLATRSTNVLADAEDTLIFHGLGAFSSPLYANFIRWRANGQPSDYGLLSYVPPIGPQPAFGTMQAGQVITVPLQAPVPPAITTTPGEYGENSFGASAGGIAELTGNGQYGPYALTLHSEPYANSYSPLPDTLIAPAFVISPLMTAGFRDSGTLDTPGLVAAALAEQAANSAGSPSAAITAAAQAAATYAIEYGASLDVAAATAATAAAAAGAPESTATSPPYTANSAQAVGATAAFTAGQAISGYPLVNADGDAVTSTGEVVVGANGLPSYFGSLVSLGGNAVDLVVAIEPTVAFMQIDTDGNYRFRVFERIALRIKQSLALIRLEFV
ncbi:MAG TPA: hypothetical protein VME22_09395 [Solirubrobacteraceae bacterium]|nr:hypothetical protein [Solirubrobacteraceae bacterium]